MDEVKITFHFVSGKSLSVVLYKQKFDQLVKNLSNEWSGTYVLNDSFGINMSLVCFYEVS